MPEAVRSAAQALGEYLDCQTTVWAYAEEQWERLEGPDEGCAATPEIDQCGSCPVVSGEADGRRRIDVSLGEVRGRRFVVSCETDLAPDLLLRRLATASLEIGRSRSEIIALEEENESSAMQLATDLEELSTLRTMVQRLSAIDTCDESLVAMAYEALPSLNEVVRAECLAYVRSHEGRCEALLTVGPREPAGDAWTALIQAYGGTTENAVVRNWREEETPVLDHDDQQIDRVRSLIVAPIRVAGSVRGWVVAVNRVSQPDGFECSWQLASDEFGSGEGTLLETAASVMSMHATSLEMVREKEQLLIGMVRTLVSAIEAKDRYTCGHSERVALFASRLAQEVGYHEGDVDNLYLSALLHDVGKIGVKDAVLNKEGKLSDEEFDEIARHPDEGWAILADLKQLESILPGILHHHERWDGRGYPDRLQGEKIPLDARIMAVVDAYDAMTSDRPYRKGMPNEKAESILREGAGSQWDPVCVEAFFSCLDDIHKIQAEYTLREKRERIPMAAYI